MVNLQYRGAKVVQEDAVKQDHIASWRGTTYNTKDVEAAPKATSGSYRGSTWEV
jgi:predicted phage gp36 major capsid-like protein